MPAAMPPIARRLTSCTASYRTLRTLAHALPPWAPHASPPACAGLLRQKCCDRATTAPPTPANLPRASRSRRPQLSGSPSALSSHRRSYHSYDHPGPAGPFSPTERAILAAAYAHAPQHGFTPKTLALGARDAGYLDISTNLLADGVFTLVQWHLVSQREALAAKAKTLFEAGEARALGVRAKVELLTWERLMGNKHANGKLQEVSQESRHTRRRALGPVRWPSTLFYDC